MRRLSYVCFLLLACQEEVAEWQPHIVCDAGAPVTMGSTPLKRLTRSQYDYSVRDVLGVTGKYSPMLAEDEQIGHFASNASIALDMTTVQMYQTAAEAVAVDADISALDDCNLLTTPGEQCANAFIQETGRRIFRRPLNPTELGAYQALYERFGAVEHVNGLRVVVQGMLQSPAFLYQPDFEVVGSVTNGQVHPLDAYALASRLSLFLWDSVPDDALLAAAESGALLTDEVLRSETLRMLSDAKTARGIGRFHAQWMGIDRLEEVAKDAEQFPQYTDEVVEGLKRETLEFADYVIRYGDAELATLLNADFTILNEAIAEFYDVPDGVEPSPLTPVYLNPDRRAGILSHGSVLAVTAHSQQTSLSRRGQLIRERLFCQPIFQPPANVSLELPTLGPDATTREQVEAHTGDPACAGCHEKMDYIGFGFEHFDAIGQYRQLDNGSMIDASGELTETDVNGFFTGAPELSEKLVDSFQVRSCVSREWLTYALGREVQSEDGCSLSAAYEAMHKPNNLRELLLAIVMSNSFRNRRIDEGGSK